MKENIIRINNAWPYQISIISPWEFSLLSLFSLLSFSLLSLLWTVEGNVVWFETFRWRSTNYNFVWMISDQASFPSTIGEFSVSIHIDMYNMLATYLKKPIYIYIYTWRIFKKSILDSLFPLSTIDWIEVIDYDLPIGHDENESKATGNCQPAGPGSR